MLYIEHLYQHADWSVFSLCNLDIYSQQWKPVYTKYVYRCNGECILHTDMSIIHPRNAAHCVKTVV